MALRIISAIEPMHVETIVLTIFGPPGTGKTTLGFSANAPLLIDADGGAYRSAFRRDVAAAQAWADIASVTREDVAPYKTLILDTAGRTLDLLTTDIIAQNPKMGRGGALTLQGYGELKARFIAYLKLMRSFGLDIVLIAHSDEKNQGDDLIERIDMQGASKNEVYKVSDAMARLGIVNGQRMLTFSPTETRFGKDPASIGSVVVPPADANPAFLSSIIALIKDRLNALTEEQAKAVEAKRERAEWWKGLLANCDSAEAFTAAIPEAVSDAEKRELLETAMHKGFAFDKKAGAFVAPAAAVA